MLAERPSSCLTAPTPVELAHGFLNRFVLSPGARLAPPQRGQAPLHRRLTHQDPKRRRPRRPDCTKRNRVVRAL
jgi:hypothetical protein